MIRVLGIIILAIGLFFGRYIGRWLVNIIDNNDTSINDGKSNAKAYLANCDTLILTLQNFKDSTSYFEVKGQFNASSNDNTAYIFKHEITFFDSKLNRSFRIYYFFQNQFFHSNFGSYIDNGVEKTGKRIVATINTKELSDPSYGTKDKPIPIIYFTLLGNIYSFYEGIEQSKEFKGSEDDFKKYMMNYNAWHYLSYVKSKADFEKMFGKQVKK